MANDKITGREVVSIVKRVLANYRGKQRFDKEEEAFWGDLRVMAGSSWRARGEEYGKGALAVITIEGSPAYGMLNYGEDGWKFHTYLVETLRDNGFWFEPMYSWALAIYELY